jgi:hypothetical protein
LFPEQEQARKEERGREVARRFGRWEARKSKGKALWEKAKLQTIKHVLGKKI